MFNTDNQFLYDKKEAKLVVLMNSEWFVPRESAQEVNVSEDKEKEVESKDPE